MLSQNHIWSGHTLDFGLLTQFEYDKFHNDYILSQNYTWIYDKLNVRLFLQFVLLLIVILNPSTACLYNMLSVPQFSSQVGLPGVLQFMLARCCYSTTDITIIITLVLYLTTHTATHTHPYHIQSR